MKESERQKRLVEQIWNLCLELGRQGNLSGLKAAARRSDLIVHDREPKPHNFSLDNDQSCPCSLCRSYGKLMKNTTLPIKRLIVGFAIAAVLSYLVPKQIISQGLYTRFKAGAQLEEHYRAIPRPFKTRRA